MVVRNGIKLLLESQDSFEVVLGFQWSGSIGLSGFELRFFTRYCFDRYQCMEEMDGIALLQVLHQIEIADKMFLSKRTVEGHRQNLIDKAGVKNTAHWSSLPS